MVGLMIMPEGGHNAASGIYCFAVDMYEKEKRRRTRMRQEISSG